MVALAALVSASATLGADMTGAAKKELQTAQTHAGFAAGYDTAAEVELHLHHVVNCLEGASGKNFKKEAGNVCEGQGNGIFADLKESGMAGAHALPYAEIANQWVLWAAVWKATAAGEYAVRVRAQDGTGVVQVKEEVGTLPDGASGYHLIRLRVSK